MHSSEMRKDIKVDLSKLPVNHVEAPDGCSGIYFILFGLFFGGLPSLELTNLINRGKWDSQVLGFFIFLGLGLFVILHGIKMLTSKKVLKIDKDRIEYSESSFFGQKAWSEKLANFMGVGCRTQFYRGGKNNHSYTFHVVEIIHRDKAKNVCLYRSQNSAGLRKIWENYCQQLNMSAIEGQGVDAVIRDVEDLDKSVVELAAEGKVEVKFDPSARPPSRLKVKVEKENLKIILPKQPFSIIGTAVGIFIAYILIHKGLFSSNFDLVPVLMGLVLGALAIGVAYWTRAIQNVVILSDKRVRFYCDSPWGNLYDTSVPASMIETIRIGRKAENKGSIGLLLITDQQTNILGEGLLRPELEWLKDCVMAVVTKKTKT